MMKTPDEIKKGLECCTQDERRDKCAKCPYADGACIKDLYAVEKDALAYIKRLEEERDQAIGELVGCCHVCRWTETEKCASCHFNNEAWNTSESNWEWRGIRESAVIVVRCKDCVHRHSSEYCECRPDDAFCSDGEARRGAGE